MNVRNLAVVSSSFFLLACPGKLPRSVPNTDTVSVTEIAEAVMSGAVQSTSPTNLQAGHFVPQNHKEYVLAGLVEKVFTFLPRAQAASSQGLCATYQAGLFSTTPGAACFTYNNNHALNLAWGPCNMAQPYGTWSGGEIYVNLNTASTTAMACSPFSFQNGDIIQRYFYSPTARIPNFGQSQNEEANPPVVLVDTIAVNSGNSNASSSTGFSYPVNSTGEFITFSGAVARTIEVRGLHVEGSIGGYIVWDFSISSRDSNGNVTALLTVDGSNNLLPGGVLFVQDNLNKVLYKTTVTATLPYVAGCGVPIGAAGTLQTVKVGGPLVETMTGFTSCGVSTLNGSNYNLTHSF